MGLVTPWETTGKLTKGVPVDPVGRSFTMVRLARWAQLFLFLRLTRNMQAHNVLTLFHHCKVSH